METLELHHTQPSRPQVRRNREGIQGGKLTHQILAGIEAKPSPSKGLGLQLAPPQILKPSYGHGVVLAFLRGIHKLRNFLYKERPKLNNDCYES